MTFKFAIYIVFLCFLNSCVSTKEKVLDISKISTIGKAEPKTVKQIKSKVKSEKIIFAGDIPDNSTSKIKPFKKHVKILIVPSKVNNNDSAIVIKSEDNKKVSTAKENIIATKLDMTIVVNKPSVPNVMILKAKKMDFKPHIKSILFNKRFLTSIIYSEEPNFSLTNCGTNKIIISKNKQRTTGADKFIDELINNEIQNEQLLNQLSGMMDDLIIKELSYPELNIGGNNKELVNTKNIEFQHDTDYFIDQIIQGDKNI